MHFNILLSSSIIVNELAALAEIVANMAALGYQYVYDHRNRLVERKVPGKGREHIVYNKLDLPVMTQDSVQRTNGEWLFTKYNAFGRVAYTGIVDNTSSRRALQNAANDPASYGTQFEGRTQSANTIGDTPVYYTHEAIPKSLSSARILTIDYYDDYDFLSSEPGMALPISVFGRSIENYDNTDKVKTKGLATGSKIWVLGTDDWITTAIGYDHKGRAIYTASNNDYLGTMDITGSKLDFTGRPEKVRTAHTRNGTTIATLDNFAYDHVGRLLSQTQCIGDETMGDSCPVSENLEASLPVTGTVDDLREATQSITVTNATLLPGAHLRISSGSGEEMIAYNHYDDLGQLVQKKVGGVPGADYQGTVGLQTVDYKYNVRGWLTDINDVTVADPNKLFNFKIGYNTGADPLYNGNIFGTQWRTANTDSSLKSYDYTYDALNRITSAIDNTTNYNLELLEYDRNGNIQKLKRKGHTNVGATTFGLMDDLEYAYDDGNRLLSVTDAVTTPALMKGEFKDGNKVGNDYSYDDNGNMVRDLNKGIGTTSLDGILYNHLNLPTGIVINNAQHNGNIQYIYTATGTKLRKIATDTGESSLTTTDYAGNYIYENDVLRQFSHPEGYVEPDGSGNYTYVYQYRDQIENVRLSYADLNGNGSIDPSSEILHERNYFPFGMVHKGYNGQINGTANNYKQYQSQEYTEDLGLNIHEWRFRFSDPTIGGRFWSIDPLTEEYRDWSPYVFSGNRVIDARELEGLEPFFVNYDMSFKENVQMNVRAYSQTAQNLSETSQFILNPVETAKGLWNLGKALLSPVDMGKAIVSNVTQTVMDVYSGDPDVAGTALGNVMSFVVETAVGAELGNLAKVGKIGSVADDVVKVGDDVAKTPVTNEIYRRPNNATTPAQRASVQNKPCVDCGKITTPMVANHKTPLVVEHYSTGTISKTNMQSLNAVNSQCTSCSASQGGKMSAYSKEMKKIINERTKQ